MKNEHTYPMSRDLPTGGIAPWGLSFGAAAVRELNQDEGWD